MITPSADEDTSEILAFLAAKAGHSVAAKYNASFEPLYDNLPDFPNSGAPRPEVGAEIRIAIGSPYVVIYRHTDADGTARALRIVHGSHKITGKLLRRAL